MRFKKRTLVLSVEGPVATTPAERVCLGVALTINDVHRKKEKERKGKDRMSGASSVDGKENVPKG